MTYDAQGNMLSTGSKTFTWDTRNRLTSIAGGTAASFSYDTMGRRITKTVPLTANTATQLTYDGANPVVEKRDATVTGTNLTGMGLDSYLTRKDGATETWPLTDHLGSTIALTDTTGAIVTSYTYEPYGATTQTGTTSTNPHQYTGRENDGTGLYFYRARYYDPQLMRFISEDPIGLAGGVNSYGYVGANPSNNTDPHGLWSVTFGGYGGAGWEVTFGNDGGNGFMTARFGFGGGAGMTYDPLGGIPGPTPNNRGEGGLVLSCSAKVDLTAGPFQAGGETGIARNYSNGESSSFGGLNGNARLDSFRGFGVTGSGAGQITIYTGNKK